MKFLISKKKDGQFRALWGDFGELVNLMASGEMVVCDAWQPAVMAVKAQGKPANTPFRRKAIVPGRSARR